LQRKPRVLSYAAAETGDTDFWEMAGWGWEDAFPRPRLSSPLAVQVKMVVSRIRGCGLIDIG